MSFYFQANDLMLLEDYVLTREESAIEILAIQAIIASETSKTNMTSTLNSTERVILCMISFYSLNRQVF